MYRRLAYVSTASRCSKTNVPEDLAGIVIAGRRFNYKNAITGLLSYKNGYYIQLLEGRHENLDPLYERIKQDHRHSGVTTIIDEDVESRVFPGWSLKLTASSSLDEAFKRLIDRFWSSINSLPGDAADRVRVFHDPEERPPEERASQLPPVEARRRFVYRISGYPRVSGKQDLTQEFLEICARMKNGWVRFDELLSASGLDAENINAVLERFQRAGLLEISEDAGVSDKAATSGADVPSFYRKLKTFFRKSTS